MKSNKLLSALLASAGVMMLMVPEMAQAASLGDIFKNVNNSIQQGSNLAGAIGYLVGFFFLLGAIFKFKQYGDNPEQHPIRTPIFLVIAAVLSVYMTSTLQSGGETIWGSGAKATQGKDGSNLNL